MNPNKLSENDLKIISSLRVNARTKVTYLSELLNLPATTIYDKIRIAEKNGLLKRHVTLIDFKKAGFPISAAILFNPSKIKFNDIGEYLQMHNNVNSLYKIIGNKYFVEVIFEDIESLLIFIDDVEKKFKTNSELYLFTEEMRKEDFLK